MTETTNTQRRAECRRFIEDEITNYVRPIEISTRDSYALIMERIWREHSPAIGTDTQKHLSSLNVQVNDIWIAAVALDHGLILEVFIVRLYACDVLSLPQWVLLPPHDATYGDS